VLESGFPVPKLGKQKRSMKKTGQDLPDWKVNNLEFPDRKIVLFTVF
jgi:hypothetical protein